MSITRDDFDFVSDLLHKESAIVLEPGKEYLVQARLLPVARTVGVSDVAGLVRELRRRPQGPLREQVVDALTTNETSFFRDVHPFEALANSVLPDLVRARGAERSLRIWCAASSSGQEPYSVAMLLADVLETRPGWTGQVLCTDISEAMVTRTRQGVYSQLEVNRGLPASRLVKHFDRSGAHWEVREELRRMVDARQMNLAAPWPALPPADIVLLRNVLIYFDVPTKRQILAQVRDVLRPDGYLFLGGAETTLNLDDAYERVQIGPAPAYRVRGGRSTP